MTAATLPPPPANLSRLELEVIVQLAFAAALPVGAAPAFIADTAAAWSALSAHPLVPTPTPRD